jgi:hypothetical protein
MHRTASLFDYLIGDGKHQSQQEWREPTALLKTLPAVRALLDLLSETVRRLPS